MKINFQNVALVFLGGAMGTAARYAASITLPQIAMLFLVNLLGAAFLGLVNSHPVFESGASKVFWGVGFAGGFTTMSGVALWMIATSSSAGLAPLTVMAMFVLGVAAYLLGLRLGKIGNRKGSDNSQSSYSETASEVAE